VFLVGGFGVAGGLLGEAILVPITEVGSLACSVGWLATCASYMVFEERWWKRATALIGALVCVALILMKFLPAVPGHFTRYEYVPLAGWIGTGIAVRRGGMGSRELGVRS
jgi:hypothetical protein